MYEAKQLNSHNIEIRANNKLKTLPFLGQINELHLQNE